MATEIVRRRWPLAAILGALALFPLAGCGGPKRVAVSGTVTLDGKPLNGGVLSFSPDASKGNAARVNCTGPVRDGHFELRTSGVVRSETGSGVPPGWYKVSLLTNLPGQREIKVNRKFTNPATSPLSVEVMDNPTPAAYNFKMTK